MNTCPICKDFQGVTTRADTTPDVTAVTCPRCGSYRITDTATTTVGEGDVKGRHLLSGLARERSDRGQPLLIRSDEVESLIEAVYVPQNPLELADHLLQRLSERADTFASAFALKAENDYPLVYGQSPNDLTYLQEYLIEAGYLEIKRGAGLRVALKGWQHLHQLRRGPIDSTKGFVAMWFDDSLDVAWEQGFKRAIEETGYEPMRLDLEHHNEKICDKILAEIRGSRFVVADFTGHRGGVYFEAGFAKGLNLEVIWTVRTDALAELHFDTRQYNHIEWRDPDDLRDQLRARIAATLGVRGA